MRSNELDSKPWIPLHAIYLKQGINIGGFMYRQYTSDGTWELHLHEGGGIISLLNKPLGQAFYISTANVDACDGVPISASSHQRESMGLTPELASQAGQNNALVCNQVRREITAEPLVTIDGPTDLGEDQKAAKAAHFKPASEAPPPLVSNPPTSISPNGFKSLQIPKPAKRKPGRPRKVPLDPAPISNGAPISDSVSSDPTTP